MNLTLKSLDCVGSEFSILSSVAQLPVDLTWQPPTVEITTSRLGLRASIPEGRKQISIRSSPLQFTRRDHAFSLMEIISVVAILAILVTLGYGAIFNLRDSGNVAASTANLRQLAVAALTYAADNNATLPPHAIFDPELGENREWCYGYFQFDTANALAQGILGPYLDDAENILRCRVWEARPEIQKMFEAGGKPGLLGYGYNGLNLSVRIPAEHSPGGQDGHFRGYPLASVTDHAKTVMFATSAMPFGENAAPQEMIWAPDHVVKEPCVRLVSDTHALVAFVDGSVRAVRAIPGTVPTSDGVVLGQLDLDEDGEPDVDIWKK